MIRTRGLDLYCRQRAPLPAVVAPGGRWVLDIEATPWAVPDDGLGLCTGASSCSRNGRLWCWWCWFISCCSHAHGPSTVCWTSSTGMSDCGSGYGCGWSRHILWSGARLIERSDVYIYKRNSKVPLYLSGGRACSLVPVVGKNVETGNSVQVIETAAARGIGRGQVTRFEEEVRADGFTLSVFLVVRAVRCSLLMVARNRKESKPARVL